MDLMGGDGWGWGMGGLTMLLFWGVIVVALVILVKWLAGSMSSSTHRTALDILKERYARGEIGKEEFEQKRRDLEG